MKQKSALKTVATRLTATHKRRDDLAAQIAAAETDRREALLADDDRVARLVDLNLLELRMAAQRAADKIKLLTPLAETESRELLPHRLEDARAKLDQLLRRQHALNGVRQVDRSAAQDMEIDTLVRQVGMLRQHIELLERIAA